MRSVIMYLPRHTKTIGWQLLFVPLLSLDLWFPSGRQPGTLAPLPADGRRVVRHLVTPSFITVITLTEDFYGD